MSDSMGITPSPSPGSPLDRYHYHEAMDRAAVALDHWNEYVTQHPVAEKHKKLLRACERAEAAMAEAYQIAATLSMKEPNEKSVPASGAPNCSGEADPKSSPAARGGKTHRQQEEI